MLRTLRSEKRIYNAGGMPMTEAAIDTGFFGDRYVSIGEPVSDKGVEGAWALRIYIKPFVDWIWGGAFLMALGGFIAMTDRRYRLAVKQKLGALGGAARRRDAFARRPSPQPSPRKRGEGALWGASPMRHASQTLPLPACGERAGVRGPPAT